MAGLSNDALLNVVGSPASANVNETTATIVGYPSNGPRIAIQLANVRTDPSSPGNSTGNLINYVASDHSLIGNVSLGGSSKVAYLPTKASPDPVAETNGAMYYNTTMNKIRVYVAGAWANVTTS